MTRSKSVRACDMPFGHMDTAAGSGCPEREPGWLSGKTASGPDSASSSTSGSEPLLLLLLLLLLLSESDWAVGVQSGTSSSWDIAADRWKKKQQSNGYINATLPLGPRDTAAGSQGCYVNGAMDR